ncbi:hypothetical protein DdX_15423 [Ditylenchus destructor]|uniref:Uncharacterized protein n=1 Tax=Ditylenchus destructor TaxID=166010 RepID=A0AAD4R0U1_9BILA|nr:hypothetical protein DdX_15423 [Ditylenchus destructor]
MLSNSSLLSILFCLIICLAGCSRCRGSPVAGSSEKHKPKQPEWPIFNHVLRVVGVRLQDNPIYSGAVISEMSAVEGSDSGNAISFDYMVDVIDDNEIWHHNNTYKFWYPEWERVQVLKNVSDTNSSISGDDCVAAERVGVDRINPNIMNIFPTLGEPVRSHRAATTLPLPDTAERIYNSDSKHGIRVTTQDPLQFGQKHIKALRLALDQGNGRRSVRCFPVENWDVVRFGYLTRIDGEDVHEKLATMLKVHPLQIKLDNDNCCEGLRLQEKLIEGGYSGIWFYNATLRGNAEEIARVNSIATPLDKFDVMQNGSFFSPDPKFAFASPMVKYFLSKHNGPLILDMDSPVTPVHKNDKKSSQKLTILDLERRNWSRNSPAPFDRVLGVRLNNSRSFSGMIISEMTVTSAFLGDIIPNSFETSVDIEDQRLIANDTYPSVWWYVVSVPRKIPENANEPISAEDCLLGDRIGHDKKRSLMSGITLGSTVRERNPQSHYFLPLPDNPQLSFMKSEEERGAMANETKSDRDRGIEHVNALRFDVLDRSSWLPELRAVGCFRLEEWSSFNFLYLTSVLDCREKGKMLKSGVENGACPKSDVHEDLARKFKVHPLQIAVKEDDESGSKILDLLLADGYSGLWLYNVTLRGSEEEIERIKSEAHNPKNFHGSFFSPNKIENSNNDKFSFVDGLVQYFVKTGTEQQTLIIGSGVGTKKPTLKIKLTEKTASKDDSVYKKA